MSYPVQVVLDQGNLPTRLREIQDWLDKHSIDTGSLNYRLRADHVRLRVDFLTLKDAARFVEIFGGSVLGARRTMPAAG